MEVRVLGPLEVSVDGVDVDVGGRRPRRLLAALTAFAGDAVPADRLVDLVWEGDPLHNPANALQAQVAKLRRVLPEGVIVTRGAAYRLELDERQIDARSFETAVANARVARDAGDHRHAVDLLIGALGLWRGPAFSDLDHPDMVAEVTRLDELRLLALEQRADSELALGRAGEVVGELEALTSAHPTRERFWAQLMTALYETGRQADALRAYQTARGHLVEELGLEPGRELQELESRILAHDDSLVPTRAERGVGAPSHAAGNLPADVTRFVGRQREEATVRDLVDRHRLVTIVGPGGAGKTRLALAVARGAQPAAGAWLVELGPITDDSAVAMAVAGALGVPEALDPSRLAATGLVTELLSGFIGHREVLLVLDNCEHLIEATARLVDALLRACPALRVLATSREGLAVTGEVLWPVPPLATDEAVELFTERALALAPAFHVDETSAGIIADICDRLDGLPLAIELAAARIRLLPLDQLRDGLGDRFRLLTGGSRAALPRQQTLRAVVDWSYDLLDKQERALFERMSVFVGGSELEAILAVVPGGDDDPSGLGVADANGAPDPTDVADVLGRLVDKSLVTAQHRGYMVRYGQLQTLAFYGRERLGASGQADAVRDRHADWFTALAEQAGDGLRGSEQGLWLDRLPIELDNLRAAFEWSVEIGNADRALRIVEGLAWFWWLRADSAEGLQWFEAALGVAGGDPLQRVRVDAWAGWYTMLRTPSADAVSRLQRTVHDAEVLGDPYTIGIAALFAANVMMDVGLRSEALVLRQRAREVLTPLNHHWGLGLLDILDGLHHIGDGDRRAARQLLNSASDHFSIIGDRWARGLVRGQLAELAEQEGDYALAKVELERSRDLFLDIGASGFTVVVQVRLGNLAMLAGDLDEADRLHAEALRAARERPVGPVLGMTLVGRALSHRRRGELAEASELLHEALEIYGANLHEGSAFAATSLGFVAELQGDADTAEHYHLRGLEAAAHTQDRRAVALAVEGLAGVAMLRGDPIRAAFFLGVAEAARESVGVPLPTAERADVDRIGAAARAAVGDEEFAAAKARGSRAPLEGLVDAVLQTASPPPRQAIEGA
jgi:predicted ATPase